MRRWIAALALLGLCVSGKGEAATRGGTFVFGASADCIFFDPVYQQQTEDIWFALNIYDTLLQPTPDGKALQPGLAASYEVSPDALTMTLILRPGIKFSDGSPILASDVKFTLDRGHTKEEGGNYYFLLNAVDTVDAVGDDKVVIHFKRPDPTFPQILASFYTGDRAREADEGAAGRRPCARRRALSPSTRSAPAPSSSSSWTHGQGFTLTRNPYYWKQGEDGKPLPYLDQVKVEILPDDATRILKLKAGEVNGVEFVPFSRAAELKADPKLNMTLFPSGKIVYLGMNIRPTLKDGTKNPLADKRAAPGAELRRREEGDRPDRDLRHRHAAAHSAARRDAATP